MAQKDLIFVGIKGTVLALDRSTGEIKWSTSLRGSDFVNVVLQDGDLFAACRGRLYRLDPSTGEVKWCNELPGLGYGILTVAGASQTATAAEKKRRDDAAAAAAASASAST
jgi:outer membrane protein assembly factor BamB